MSLFIILIVGFIGVVASVSFDIKMDHKKCFTEEFGPNVLMNGRFDVNPSSGDVLKSLFVSVTDPMGATLYSSDSQRHEAGGDPGDQADRPGTSGQFSITTVHGGDYTLCFQERWTGAQQDYGLPERRVNFHWESGVDAVDYSSIAKKEHLKPLEVELRRIEDTVKQISQGFEYGRSVEAAHRDTSESTNSKVQWLSLFSVLVLIGLGVFQVFYLRNYFQRKKLL